MFWHTLACQYASWMLKGSENRMTNVQDNWYLMWIVFGTREWYCSRSWKRNHIRKFFSSDENGMLSSMKQKTSRWRNAENCYWTTSPKKSPNAQLYAIQERRRAMDWSMTSTDIVPENYVHKRALPKEDWRPHWATSWPDCVWNWCMPSNWSTVQGPN